MPTEAGTKTILQKNLLHGEFNFCQQKLMFEQQILRLTPKAVKWHSVWYKLYTTEAQKAYTHCKVYAVN
jgi:hypothetical protein